MYGELPTIENREGKQIAAFPVVVQNPLKQCFLRLPTTAELLVYLAAQRSLYRDLGRRIGEGEDVPNPKADMDLFTAIRLDSGGEAFDESEAAYAIGLLTQHRASSCEREGQSYIIKLMTMFGPVTHTVSIPFQKDIAEYRRNVYKSRDLPHGVEERRFPPEVPVKLYDKVIQDTVGYIYTEPGKMADVVPPHHKRTVVAELMAALIQLDPALDPN